MITIKNKEFSIQIINSILGEDGITVIEVIKKSNTSFFNLFEKLSRTPSLEKGLGDRKEQQLRIKLMSKFQDAILDKKTELKIEDAHAEFFKNNLKNMTFLVLNQGYIDFQTTIEDWKLE